MENDALNSARARRRIEEVAALCGGQGHGKPVWDLVLGCAEEAYALAAAAGEDVSPDSCRSAYSDAVRRYLLGRSSFAAPNWLESLDDARFSDYYACNILGTLDDELADMTICCASWLAAEARRSDRAGGLDKDSAAALGRCVDDIARRVSGLEDRVLMYHRVRQLAAHVRMKTRYNRLHPDHAYAQLP